MILYTGLLNVILLFRPFYKSFVFFFQKVNTFLLFTGNAKAHGAADVVIFQDTKTHSFPTGDLFGRFDIIRVIRNLPNKYDPCIFHKGIVGDAVTADIITVFL